MRRTKMQKKEEERRVVYLDSSAAIPHVGIVVGHGPPVPRS
jgi:hypothetical protein